MGLTIFTQKVNFTNGTKIEISYVVDDVNLILFSRFHVKPQMHPVFFAFSFGPEVQRRLVGAPQKNKAAMYTNSFAKKEGTKQEILEI